jgi:methylated-DNA-[protein]-cysteine S-methyltransferase
MAHAKLSTQNPFSTKVYTFCKQIPPGRISTYKEVAKALHTKACRAVGQALRDNPYAPIVPCHRVVSSDGTIGGFNGNTKGKSIWRKISMLRKEGIKIENNRILNFDRLLYRFKS